MKDAPTPKTFDRRQFLVNATAGATAISAGAFGFPAIAASKKKLTIGYIPILDHLLLAISHNQDNPSFKSVNIHPRLFKSWSSLAGALRAGVIDGAFLLSNFAMDLFNHGVPIRNILVGHRHGSAITVRHGSNIQGAKDLIGKKIAIPARLSTHNALLDTYLRTAGLSLSDVKTHVIAPSHMVNVMKRGGIDAFIVAEPFCAKAELENVGQTLVFSKNIISKHICCIIVLREEILHNNRDSIQEWVNSLIRAGNHIDREKTGHGVDKIVKTASLYMPHSERTILKGLKQPVDRLIYNDLNPLKSDFQQIVEISTQAGLMKPVDLDRFTVREFYDQAET
ncbi:MAG: ABC transporter substrate-binding protein [Magnetococcales bacterium]|nr:ABC transporter substrate-binding protein [Magnetococcales bacterium]